MGLKIGVTGGIGSGKSIICRIFSVLGIPVFDADKQAVHEEVRQFQIAGQKPGYAQFAKEPVSVPALRNQKTKCQAQRTPPADYWGIAY